MAKKNLGPWGGIRAELEAARLEIARLKLEHARLTDGLGGRSVSEIVDSEKDLMRRLADLILEQNRLRDGLGGRSVGQLVASEDALMQSLAAACDQLVVSEARRQMEEVVNTALRQALQKQLEKSAGLTAMQFLQSSPPSTGI